jgi:putative cell wall-binding protein
MMHPNAVIIARGDGLNYQEALISSPLTHFPRNGPVLLTPPDNLSPVVAQEIVRLCPTGHNSPAQVITIGSLSPNIDQEITRLGFTVCRINGGDPAATAVMIWDVLGPRDNVILTSGETFEEALPAGGWAAHHGDPILLTCRDQLPMMTARAIQEHQPDVYILGSERTISRRVEAMVRDLTYGFVDRIGGNTPAEVSVNFTRYKSPTRKFGWDVRDRRGWSFRFSRLDDWTSALNGDPLSHMGKHSPLLLIDPNEVSQVVRQYIISVNPIHPEPKPPFMHGFIVGINGSILCPVQLDLDSLLETVKDHGEM